MKLYKITMSGKKFYFAGYLSPCLYDQIEQFCRDRVSNTNNTPQKLFELLVQYITTELRQEITPIEVEHIFRVNLQ